MHLQMQQLQQRLSQLQRELSDISQQLSNLSSMSYSAGSMGQMGQIGGYGMGQSFQGYAPGNIAAYTPSHSSRAGVGDFGQSFSTYSGYGMGGGMGGYTGQTGQVGNIASYTPSSSSRAGSSEFGSSYGSQINVSDYHYPAGGGYGQNISAFTGPSATAGFSETGSSPTGRPDYGVGGSQQAYRLGR
ncbi:MAG TPA: hypothetical protein GX504_05110 [Clostridia bacterium]|nr:hypothetical protein [Clostridia bacterium]